MITRRTALALPLVAMVPSVAASELPLLSCFLMDILSIYYTVAEGPERVEYDAPQYGLSLLPNGDFLPFMWCGCAACKMRDKRVTVYPRRFTDAELNEAAGAMLLLMAESPVMAYFDHEHEHHRYIEVKGKRLSVADPEHLGRLVIFPDGRRGLAIHNSAAVVLA